MDKKLKEVLLLLFICLLPLLLTFNNSIANKALLLELVIFNIIIYGISRKIDINTLKTLIFIIMFQNLFLVIFASSMTSSTMNLYVLTKEIFVILIVAYAFIRSKRNINILDILVSCFISVIVFSFITSDAEIRAKLANARQLLLPIGLFYFGNIVNVNDYEYKNIFRLIVNLGKIVFVIGIIQFVLGERLFDYISVYEFYEKKGLLSWINNGKYPLSFIAWDLHQIFELFIVRFLSIFYEALTAGHIMALCFVITLFDKSFKKNKINMYLWNILFLLGTVLTFSKGAYIIVMISIIVKVYERVKNKKILYIISGISVMSSVLLVFALWDKVVSIRNHVIGLISNITSAKFFSGASLGNVGVYANAFSQSNNSNGESLIGNLAGQFGLVTTIIFIFIMLIMIYLNILSRKEGKLISVVLIFGVFLEMFLSESSVAFLSTGLYFIISGLYSDLDNYSLFKINIPKF